MTTDIIIADQRAAERYAHFAREDFASGDLSSAAFNQSEAAYYAAHARRQFDRSYAFPENP